MIYEQSHESLVVVTAFRVGIEKPKRYGFTEKFDEEAAALYFKLRKGKVVSTEPLAENVIVDLDNKGKLLGLELLLSPQMKPEVRKKLLEAI